MTYPLRTPEKVQFWSSRIDYTIRKLRPLFQACEVLTNQYYNEPSTEREASGGSRIGEEEHIRRTKCNIIYGYIDQSLSNMLDRAPVFQCFPETVEAAQRTDPADPNSPTFATGTSKIVNYRYRETNQLRVDERVALSSFLFPYGVAKIGYTHDMDRKMQELLQPAVSTELEFEDPNEENLFLSIGQPTRVSDEQDHRWHIETHTTLLQGGILGMTGEQADTVEQTVVEHVKLHKRFFDRSDPAANTNIQRESPFAVWWPSDMFLTDLLSMEGPQDARWIAFGWELPFEEVQGSADYENTSDLKPSRWNDAPDRQPGVENDAFDMVQGWEVWAKNFPIGRGKFRDLLLTVAEGHDKFLRYEEEWPYDRIDDYPCETLSFTSGLRRWFHKPPVLQGGGDTVQALVNEVLDANLSTIRKQKNVWLVDPASGITTEILQKVLDAPDGSAIQVPGLMDAKGTAVLPLPFHQIPPEKGEMISVLQTMFDRALGTPQPIRMPSTDTATEASIVEKRNTSRENRKAGLLAEFQVRKARKMWQLDAQFQSPRLFLVDKHSAQFLQITAEMAKGEYLFTMDITSQSTALAVERSQWMDLLNLFAGLTPVMIQTFGMPPNLPELARRLLVRGFNERVVEEILPMLETAAQKMAAAPLFGPDGQPLAPQAQVQEPASQAAVQQGRATGREVGALAPEQFNRDVPNEGRQAGEVLRG